MSELIDAAIHPFNLPFTVLVGLIVLYWLFVILGAIDMDMFHADWMPDIDLDADGFSVLGILGIGNVPIMLVVSILVVLAWWFSIVANYFFNSGHVGWIALLLLIPNLLITVFVAGLVIRPLAKIFAAADKDTVQSVIYRVGTVTTGEVTSSFGQIEIENKGGPITVNVRTSGDVVLKKGDKALIFDEDRDKGIYFVEKFEE